MTGPGKIGHICKQNLALFLTLTYNIFLSSYKAMTTKCLHLIHKSIRKQTKFTELEYRRRKVPFSEGV